VPQESFDTNGFGISELSSDFFPVNFGFGASDLRATVGGSGAATIRNF